MWAPGRVQVWARSSQSRAAAIWWELLERFTPMTDSDRQIPVNRTIPPSLGYDALMGQKRRIVEVAPVGDNDFTPFA